jgi:hypothetical protein
MMIHTVIDLRTWADNCGGLGNADVQALVDAIHDDDERPAWGHDWSNYLARIDIAATVLAGEIVHEDRAVGESDGLDATIRGTI